MSARRRGARICFEDGSGFSLLPAVRATWAPKGRTPVLRHRFNWTRMSMSAALDYRPDASAAALVFATRDGSYNKDSLIEFLTDLHGHFGADKLTLIWDGLPPHRSRIMQNWIATQRHWLAVDRAARPRPRTQPGRTDLGQRQSRRTRQPLPGHHRRSARRRRDRSRTCRHQGRPLLRVPRPHRSIAMTDGQGIGETT
jgi:DDE superfamily endonuclease